MPKDEGDNVISDAEYDHLHKSDGRWYETKDEGGNIVKRDSGGNELYYNPKSGERKVVSTR